MKNYRPRILDKIIERRLANKGAILVEGAKWSGKTTTCERHAASVLYLNDPANVVRNLQMADINPAALLRGAAPRLIDEWQLAPKLWDAVRFEVDRRGDFGQFLLTGSAVPAETEAVRHTGTGRFAWLKMRPMSLWESGESTGAVSLAALFSQERPDDLYAECALSLEEVAWLLCRGGWPQATRLEGDDALVQAFDYLDAVVRADISRVDGVKRSEERARLIMKSYARLQGTSTPCSTIVDDVKTHGVEISVDTVKSYVEALRKIFVVEDCSAWNPNLRSKTAIRTSDTRYFVDPSVATAALGVGPGALLDDLETFGLFFETLCMRDLRAYAEALDGRVYHFRTKDGLESDGVVCLRDGRYGLLEFKLGGDRLIEEGAQNLKKVAEKLDVTKMKNPSFLAVIAATAPFAYKRPDDVFVIPVGSLKD